MMVKQVTPLMDSALKRFCDKCNELGYKNNDSLKAMKYEWLLEQGGVWHCVTWGGLEEGYGDMLSLSLIHI